MVIFPQSVCFKEFSQSDCTSKCFYFPNLHQNLIYVSIAFYFLWQDQKCIIIYASIHIFVVSWRHRKQQYQCIFIIRNFNKQIVIYDYVNYLYIILIYFVCI